MAEKKRFLWGIAVAALVFVVGLVACDNGTTPEDEPPKSEPPKSETTGDETELETYQSAGLYVNDAETPEPEVSGLDPAFDWIKANAEDDGSYTIVLDEDIEVPRRVQLGNTTAFLLNSAAVNGKTGVTITLIGLGGERTIYVSGNSGIFRIYNCRLILGNNITLDGQRSNNYSLVGVATTDLDVVPEFQMLDGPKITGNRETAVDASFNTMFIMKGGEIYDNVSNSSAVVISGGTFIMSGGKIYGNTCTSRGTVNSGTGAISSAFVAGGGVCLNGNDNIFRMSGGEIYGNHVVYNTPSNYPWVGNGYGGGVALVDLPHGGTVNEFIKTGGVIYGYIPGDRKSNRVIKNGVVQTDKGSAVAHVLYSNNPTDENLYKTREASALEGDNMDLSETGPDGGWILD